MNTIITISTITTIMTGMTVMTIVAVIIMHAIVAIKKQVKRPRQLKMPLNCIRIVMSTSADTNYLRQVAACRCRACRWSTPRKIENAAEQVNQLLSDRKGHHPGF